MILHLYFARRFLWTFLSLALTFAVLLGLIDLVDEVQDHPDLQLVEVLEIVLLNMPHANYEIMPLILILASVALFVRLGRSSEIVVVRAAGRSALTGLAGPVTVAGLIGLLAITMFNPIVAASSKRYGDLNNRIAGEGENVLAISDEGLWLRQGVAEGQTVIHAVSASPDLNVLYGATFIDFTRDGDPQTRVTAESARLGDGEWVLQNAKFWDLAGADNPEASAETHETLRIPAALTRDRIIDSFGKPEYIPIWDLPAFINQLESAGFSARRYAVWFQMELAQPIFLIALVVIGAAFTMRHARLANTGTSVLAAVMLGFSLHYVRNFAQVLGENGQIPVALAAWAPPVASLLLALGLFLQREEG